MEMDSQTNGLLVQEGGGSSSADKMKGEATVIFVLGGPGSGKGTQCTKIVEHYGFVHLSAGDLLRAEVASGSENGVMLQNMMKEGKIVPAEVTVGLLQAAMTKSGKSKFLIDGFPRDEENRRTFERVTGIDPEFILFFDCPEDVMEKRLLSRGQGRADDNIETIRKRFKVFVSQSVPVVDYYDKLGKVRKVNATDGPDEVFTSLKSLFSKFLEGEVLGAATTHRKPAVKIATANPEQLQLARFKFRSKLECKLYAHCAFSRPGSILVPGGGPSKDGIRSTPAGIDCPFKFGIYIQ